MRLVIHLLCLLQDPPLPPQAGQEAAPSFSSLPIHASIRARQRVRWASGQSDADLYEFVTLSYGDPAQDAVTFSSSARFAEDLDGEGNANGYHAFDSLDDTYRHATTARLYTAYVDLHQFVPGVDLRGGRQILDEMPEAVPMDGGTIHASLGDVTLAVFGGVPVNLFESSPDGDAMYGGWIEVAPWTGGRARVEYLHLEDETLFGAFDDDLAGVSLAWHGFQARYTLLEGESRDVTARATLPCPDAELIVDVQGTWQFERVHALSYAIDPYALFLFDLEPYLQGSLRASKSFGRAFAIDASVTARELVEDAREGAFNREFLRCNVTPRLDGWPWEDVSLALSADFWRSSEDDFWTIGGDLNWRAYPGLTLAAGSAYALYTVDTFTGQPRQESRTLYASMRWKMRADLALDLRYTVEWNTLDDFRTLEVGARHEF